MSLSSDRMLKLMAFADGELEGADRAEAEQLIATDADAASFVAELANLGGLVESGHDARFRNAIESFDVADAVMSLTDSKAVTSLASHAQRRAKPKPMLGIGFGVAAALALAASVLLFLRNRSEEIPMATGPERSSASVGAVSPSGTSGPGVAIESAGNSVSVFYLPTANELSTSVVVWVDETGEK